MRVDNTNYPDFLVVGTGKAGTSSMHEIFKLHPEIFVPQRMKEMWFLHLNTNPNKAVLEYLDVPQTIDQYLAHFKSVNTEKAVGEITPSYLYYNNFTIENIKRFHPRWEKLKIIIVLRDPIEKIKSQYRFVKLRGFDKENLSFSQSIEKEPSRIRNNDTLPDLLYVDSSRYYSKVKSFMDNFDFVKVVLFDDLKSDAKNFYNDLFDFLGVSSMEMPEVKSNRSDVSMQANIPGAKNIYKLTWLKNLLPDQVITFAKKILFKQRPFEVEYDSSTLEKIKNLLKSDINKLEGLIKRDLSTWMQ